MGVLRKESVKYIVVHCSASKEGVDLNASDIDRMHKQRGWKGIGYHKVIKLDGTVENGRPLNKTGAHVKGKNSVSVGLVYIGGLDSNGKAKDTRTELQQTALANEIIALKKMFPGAVVVGHRDLSPDLDGDGVVEPHEWMKECPCFDAKTEYKFISKM